MDREVRTCVRLIGLFLILWGSSAPSAAASELLASMGGRWKGEGWAKRTVDGARETVRCRLANTYFPDSRELVVSGKCAVPGKKFDFKGALSSKDGNDKISGRLANPFGLGSTAVTGRLQGNRALLIFSAPDPGTGKELKQQMIWQVGDSGFKITSKVLGSGGKALSSLHFQR